MYELVYLLIFIKSLILFFIYTYLIQLYQDSFNVYQIKYISYLNLYYQY